MQYTFLVFSKLLFYAFFDVFGLFFSDFSNLYRNPHPDQARNQLGTPGGAKSFLRGAQNF